MTEYPHSVVIPKGISRLNEILLWLKNQDLATGRDYLCNFIIDIEAFDPTQPMATTVIENVTRVNYQFKKPDMAMLFKLTFIGT